MFHFFIFVSFIGILAGSFYFWFKVFKILNFINSVTISNKIFLKKYKAQSNFFSLFEQADLLNQKNVLPCVEDFYYNFCNNLAVNKMSNILDEKKLVNNNNFIVEKFLKSIEPLFLELFALILQIFSIGFLGSFFAFIFLNFQSDLDLGIFSNNLLNLKLTFSSIGLAMIFCIAAGFGFIKLIKNLRIYYDSLKQCSKQIESDFYQID